MRPWSILALLALLIGCSDPEPPSRATASPTAEASASAPETGTEPGGEDFPRDEPAATLPTVARQESQRVRALYREAATADAAATALFVAGPDDWTALARRMGIRYVMLIDRDGVVHMNPAMQSRVRFETDTPTIRLSKPLT